MSEAFTEFSKIARLSRTMTITEKIDGTNAQIYIETLEGFAETDPNCIAQKDGLAMFAASRRDHPELPLGQGRPQDTWAQKFEAYNEAHPESFADIYFAAVGEMAGGATRISMKAIFESLRRQHKGINNNFTSFYTDLLIERHPFFDAYFERRARAKGKMARHYERV